VKQIIFFLSFACCDQGFNLGNRIVMCFLQAGALLLWKSFKALIHVYLLYCTFY
jgi:hypothetical protein